MTTELTKAAQQALEVLKTYRDAYNQAWVSGMDILEPDGDKAIDELESALTQRPAAQEVERDLIERITRSIAWLERGELLSGSSACIGLDDLKTIKRLLSDGSVTKIVNMPTEPSLHLLNVGWGICGGDGHASAQPNRQKINVASANYAALLKAISSLPAPQQATPEPVPRSVFIAGNETAMCAFAARDLAERYVSNFGGATAGGMTVVELPVVGATPEPVVEPVARVELMQTGGNAGLATRIVEIYDPLRERLRPGDLLFARPAPGVPDGFALVPMTEDELNEMALQLGREMKGLRCWGWMDLVRAVERHHSKKLAAAQAKGGE